MKRKIVIEKNDNKIRTYIFENDEVVEIHSSPTNEEACRLGDIYIGKVQNIVKNIGAAFIDIGNNLCCYFDIKDAENAVFTHKSGKKDLCIGDELVVQVSREAVKTKAPTATSKLSFTGRYAVLTHGNTRIGVSSKLNKKDRDELKEKLSSMKNDQYGLVIRTNAVNTSFENLMDEIAFLEQEYTTLVQTSKTRKCFTCLKSAPPSYILDLKNVYSKGLEEIIVEDNELYTCIQSHFRLEYPELLPLLKKYNKPDFPLKKLYSTETILEKALRPLVWLKTGGYLIIQATEALTVIDVNSGKAATKKGSEEGAMKVNLEAAKEVAKQIRLRNLSGIIIIDFINMDSEEQINDLLKQLNVYLSHDPIQTTLVDMTALGLVEITRKKVRKPLSEQENYLQGTNIAL